MKAIRYLILIIAFIIIYASCKKPYLPPVVNSNNNYLVVEGLINTGQDPTVIKLSRTVKTTTLNSNNFETNATVVIQGDDNTSYPLYETAKGTYTTAGLNSSAAHKYRLNITTSDNRIYQSDFVAVKMSPAIDSVSYAIKSGGVQINLSTHDPANNTTYYRWEYDETWIIHSKYPSSLRLITIPKDTVIFRTPDLQNYICWTNGSSSTINLSSTAKLAKDVLVNNPITFIDGGSERISDRYSILVKQYALTKEAFNYWQQLKKNTENLGSIFDPQPSEISGNIHCLSNPSEPVIGFISAGSITSKRIFIDTRNLPNLGFYVSPNECILDTVLFYNPKSKLNDVAQYIYSGLLVPIDPVAVPGGKILGYTASSIECVDCTLRGSYTPPPFWK